MRRRVVRSKTATDGLARLVAQGRPKFGGKVVASKVLKLDRTISQYLAASPHRGLVDQATGLRFYPVTDTPFVIVYEYDERELRVLFITHASADRSPLERANVRW
jgi:hypothetical protein